MNIDFHKETQEHKLPTMALLLMLMLALAPVQLVAGEIQSHDSIMHAARQHILDQDTDYLSPPEITVGKLDNRLRLTKCGLPLETFTPQGKRRMGKITVGVRCNGENPWSLFVPINVKVMAEVVVARNGLPRGAIIRPDDIILKQRDLARLHRGYLEQTKLVIGKKLRQRLRRDQVVTPSQLDTPNAVKRNSRVTILSSNKVLQVRMAGKALQNGSMGELIRVRNESSKRELDARVIAPGVVEVAM
jgi:flagellar basal body P-ring formation protein FlgA